MRKETFDAFFFVFRTRRRCYGGVVEEEDKQTAGDEKYGGGSARVCHAEDYFLTRSLSSLACKLYSHAFTFTCGNHRDEGISSCNMQPLFSRDTRAITLVIIAIIVIIRTIFV